MLVATGGEIPGRHVAETLGVVRGNTVRAKYVVRKGIPPGGLFFTLRNFLGGEVDRYTDLLEDARQQAHDRMVEKASELGANAIVNVRYLTSPVMGGGTELLAYGTAVRLEDA